MLYEDPSSSPQDRARRRLITMWVRGTLAVFLACLLLPFSLRAVQRGLWVHLVIALAVLGTYLVLNVRSFLQAHREYKEFEGQIKGRHGGA